MFLLACVTFTGVMPGLVPGISIILALPCTAERDSRDKPGHDDRSFMMAGKLPLLQQRIENERSFLTGRRHRIALGVEAGFYGGVLRRAGRRRAVGQGQLRAWRGINRGSGRQFERPCAPAGRKREGERRSQRKYQSNPSQSTLPNTETVIDLTKRGGDIVSANSCRQSLANRFNPACSAV
jgi:hypothetical protein